MKATTVLQNGVDNAVLKAFQMHDNLEHATRAVLEQRTDVAISKDRKALARRVAVMRRAVPASGSSHPPRCTEVARPDEQRTGSQLGGPASSQRNSGKGGVAEVAGQG